MTARIALTAIAITLPLLIAVALLLTTPLTGELGSP